MQIPLWSVCFGVGAFILSWLLPHFVENPPPWFVRVGVFSGVAFLMLGVISMIFPEWVLKPSPWPLIVIFFGFLAIGIGSIFLYNQYMLQVSDAGMTDATKDGGTSQNAPSNIVGNVTGNNNTIIQQNTVTQQPAPPKVIDKGTLYKSLADGTHEYRTVFDVVAPYPPANMEVIIIGEGILESTNIGPNRSGFFQVQRERKKDGTGIKQIIPNPHGEYVANIVTSVAVPPKIYIDWNK